MKLNPLFLVNNNDISLGCLLRGVPLSFDLTDLVEAGDDLTGGID